MKLIDLHPRWVIPLHWASKSPFYIGVSFLCPKCTKVCPTCGHDPAHRLAVMFWPPVDPDGLQGKLFNPFPHNGEHTRTGDSFDSLTLTPSVGIEPCWHGSIVAGAIQ